MSIDIKPVYLCDIYVYIHKYILNVHINVINSITHVPTHMATHIAIFVHKSMLGSKNYRILDLRWTLQAYSVHSSFYNLSTWMANHLVLAWVLPGKGSFLLTIQIILSTDHTIFNSNCLKYQWWCFKHWNWISNFHPLLLVLSESTHNKFIFSLNTSKILSMLI